MAEAKGLSSVSGRPQIYDFGQWPLLPSLSSNACNKVGLWLHAVITFNNTVLLALPDTQNSMGWPRVSVGRPAQLCLLSMHETPGPLPTTTKAKYYVPKRWGQKDQPVDSILSYTATYRSARDSGRPVAENTQQWAREMAPIVRIARRTHSSRGPTFPAPTLGGSLPTAYGSSSWESSNLFWPSWAPNYMHTQT